MIEWLKKLFGRKEVGFDLCYLIKKYEGCRLEAYRCPAGLWTIGWGSTFYVSGQKVKQGDKITQEDADSLLMWYCSHIKLPNIQLTTNQKIALYSLIYNIGQAAFDKSKCKKAIEEHDWRTAYKEWTWTTAKGVELKGLVKRRNDEKELFFEGLV